MYNVYLNTDASVAKNEVLKKFPEGKWQILPKIVPPLCSKGFMLETVSCI